MTRKLALTCATLSALFLLFAGRAGAQNRPCADDTRKYCPDVTPGKGAIMKCLKPHMSDLSEACQKRVAQFEEQQKATSEERQKARALRGAMHTSPPSGATPAAPAPAPKGK